MAISLNPNNLMKALQMAAPALGPLAGPIAGLLQHAVGQQSKALDQLKSDLGQLQQQFSKAGGAGAGQAAGAPQPFSPVSISVHIVMNPMGSLQQAPGAAGGPLQSFGKVGEVGNDSQWATFANQANARITGNDKSFNFNGTNPWNGAGDKADMAAVGWGLQKNDKLRFDSDSKQFYTTGADGSRRNVASLDEVKAQISKAGGANPNNSAAYNAVGAFLDGRVSNPPAGQQAGPGQAQSANPFQEIIQMIEKLLKALTGGGAGHGRRRRRLRARRRSGVERRRGRGLRLGSGSGAGGASGAASSRRLPSPAVWTP